MCEISQETLGFCQVKKSGYQRKANAAGDVFIDKDSSGYGN